MGFKKIHMNGRGLRTNGFAFQGIGADIGGGNRFGTGHGDRGACINACKINALFALVSCIHTGDNHVIFIGQQSRNNPVPILHNPCAFHLHLGTECIGIIDLKAFQLFFGIEIIKRRICSFRADPNFFPVFLLCLALHNTCCKHGCRNQRSDQKTFHSQIPLVVYQTVSGTALHSLPM